MKFVLLLRGINVGGHTSVKMADLKSCLEKAGFENVKTYINSGNVILGSSEKSSDKLTSKIEKLLLKQFKMDLKVVVINESKYKKIIENAPKWWDGNAEYRHYLLFMKSPIKASEALKDFGEIKEDIEFAEAGDDVIYSSALIKELTKTGIMKIASKPVYKQMTIRNYNTSLKLMNLINP